MCRLEEKKMVGDSTDTSLNNTKKVQVRLEAKNTKAIGAEVEAKTCSETLLDKVGNAYQGSTDSTESRPCASCCRNE